jgi:hypothetical protein
MKMMFWEDQLHNRKIHGTTFLIDLPLPSSRLVLRHSRCPTQSTNTSLSTALWIKFQQLARLSCFLEISSINSANGSCSTHHLKQSIVDVSTLPMQFLSPTLIYILTPVTIVLVMHPSCCYHRRQTTLVAFVRDLWRDFSCKEVRCCCVLCLAFFVG